MRDTETTIPASQRRGRGATNNRSGRFERETRAAFDDGWGSLGEAAPLRTEITRETPRRIITRNASPDVPFDRSINPYRGCEHGCVYCFARPTHAFLGLSAGLDFETRLTVKPEAAQLLARELGRPSYSVAPIAVGTNTDPYQPIEKTHRIMREILEVLSDHRHPVTIVTKGALIDRDLDLLGEMGRAGLAQVGVSLTTLDVHLSRTMEPRAASPARRLASIARLADAGVPMKVMLAPVIPGLNDHEIEALLGAARGAGVRAASLIALRLPLEVAGLFEDWLAEAYPDRAARVMRQVRALRGGRIYDPAWGRRMRGEGVAADLMQRRFAAALARLGLSKELPPLRCDLFRPPAADAPRQLSLF